MKVSSNKKGTQKAEPKIVQISIATGVEDACDVLYALDENGGLWRLVVESGRTWKCLPSICDADGVEF